MTISCTFANPEETRVLFTDNRGDTYTVPVDWPGRFREEENDGGGVVGFLAGGGVIGAYVAPETPDAPLALQQFACARLTIDGGEVSGVERSTGIAGAFAFGDTVLAFFEEEQPDIDYTVTPNDGADKYTDHVEITRPSLTSIAFILCRVQ